MSPTQRLLPDNTQSPQEADIYSMSLVGFEPAILARKRTQTLALDRLANAISSILLCFFIINLHSQYGYVHHSQTF